MYEVTADHETNRLYIEFEGRMEKETLEEAADETIEKANELEMGFDIINDVSEFKPPSPDAAEAAKRAQDEFVERGVDRVIRVVDDDTSGVVVNAFERRSRKAGYSGETAESVAEAEELLESEDVDGYAD